MQMLFKGFIDNGSTILPVLLLQSKDRSTTHPEFDQQGLNSRPPDHDSTFHVTETPALTTRPSVTSPDQNMLSPAIYTLRRTSLRW